MELHNKARLARGLAPLPHKRCCHPEQTSLQACSSPPAADDGARPTATISPAPSLDLLLANLAMDDDDGSEGSMSDEDGGDSDEPGDAPAKVKHAPLSTDPPHLRVETTDASAGDGIAAQHPYYGYASPFAFVEPQRGGKVRYPACHALASGV